MVSESEFLNVKMESVFSESDVLRFLHLYLQCFPKNRKEAYFDYANYIKITHSTDKSYMEKWIYSKIQLDSEKITLFQEDQKTMKFEIQLSRFLILIIELTLF